MANFMIGQTGSRALSPPKRAGGSARERGRPRLNKDLIVRPYVGSKPGTCRQRERLTDGVRGLPLADPPGSLSLAESLSVLVGACFKVDDANGFRQLDSHQW